MIPDSLVRLWWVATDHDGNITQETDSTENIDRASLAHFGLVDKDGTEVFGLDFPEGEDPKLVYRRRTFVGAPLPDEIAQDPERPEWLRSPWTYVVGYHYADGTLQLWTFDGAGFVEGGDVELVPAEMF